MRFTKMQCCGNDYIYVNAMEERVESPGRLAKAVSDRHFGIGADGRNGSGVPFLIHHGNPVDGAVEHDDMRKMPITGHYRWDGSRI